MKTALVFAFLLISSSAFAGSVEYQPQDLNAMPSGRPHPYFFGSLNLNGGGYATFSESVGIGMNIERRKFLFDGNASYEDARKVNDSTPNNDKGHERRFGGDLFYRVDPWYFGGGASWSQTSTTNYEKQAWHPRLGVGRDFIRQDYSMRLQALYVGEGSDRINGLQGVELGMWLPSPATRHHLFWHQTVASYVFHDTITDFTNKKLTAIQSGNHSVATFVNFGLMARF